MQLIIGGSWILLMDLGLKLLASNEWRPMKDISYLCLKKRATIHMCVKDMNKMMTISIRIASGKTLISSIRGYLKQEAYCILGACSMWVFSQSKNFPENFGYLPSRELNCTPNTVSISANGVIASNHLSREDIISRQTQHLPSMINIISCHPFRN